MKVTKTVLTEDFDVKYTEEGIFLPNDMCMFFLATEFSNEQRFDIDDPKRELLEDFAMWLEGLLGVCDGRKDKYVYRED